MGFLFDEAYRHDFQLFGWLHITILILAAGSIVAAYRLRDPLRQPTIGRVFRYTVAVLLFGLELAYQIWIASTRGFHWVDAAPLGLCAMLVWIVAVALLFDLKAVVEVVLPWAFVGATLSFAVVNMGTSYALPHFRFFHYFAIHWLFFIGCLYYLITGRITYGYKDLLRSTAWLAVVAMGVLAIDLATDQNFMFLVEWPEELSFVNEALAFPLNTLALIAGIFVLFNVFYLIFARTRHTYRDDPPA